MLLGTSDDVQCQTNQPLVTDSIQARRLSLLGHIGHIRHDFFAFCGLEETVGVTTNVLDEDLYSHRLSWTEAVNLTQN